MQNTIGNLEVYLITIEKELAFCEPQLKELQDKVYTFRKIVQETKQAIEILRKAKNNSKLNPKKQCQN